MDDKYLRNLQIYIGKRSKGQSDSDVIAHINKISDKQEITKSEWEKLLYPTCANCNITILDYILNKLHTINNPNQFIQHTLRFRYSTDEYEKKQVIVIDRLFTYTYSFLFGTFSKPQKVYRYFRISPVLMVLPP